MLPVADFSDKERVFRFSDSNARVDLGRSTGHWIMQDDRKCISELSIDRAGCIFETYFFAQQGLEDTSVQALFELVKAAHLNYDCVSDIGITARVVADRTGTPFHALDVCIADADSLFRKRPPFFEFYQSPNIPRRIRWNALEQYRQYQRSALPFLLIEGTTGSPSWGDSNSYRIVPVDSLSELESKLRATPCAEPKDDYSKFNLGVIDVRDPAQPFTEAVYCLATQWRCENPDTTENAK
ncbi:hypothetical protein [Tateyamaria pelophila]|uniref:hypothetical protein n=1 Tax=Tateyamaria pelophila TaxID=328415 RepID=UPI001CBB9252|nr:hypothetical protein [Tateyamaria pelophila]